MDNSYTKIYIIVLNVYDRLAVVSPQSAALQKKLRQLEVQLNNDKQFKDDLEHKYR